MQDTNGNALYPHTSGDLVNYDSSKTVNQKIDEAIANLNSLKSSLATAVNNKTGSSLSSSSTIADITAKVNTIVTLSSGSSDATATASQILSGSTAYVKGSKVTGAMTDQGTKTSSLNCGASYTIPAGYHNGSGKVTANSLASQTSATAMAENILSGQTAYVNGSKITGTMANKGSYTAVTSWCPYQTNLFFRFPAGFYSGGTYDGDTSGGAECSLPMEAITTGLGITGDKIVSGNTILGIAGTATVQSLGGTKIAKGQTTTTWASGTTLKCTIPSAGFVPSLAIISTQSEGQTCNNLIVCSNGATTYPSHLFGGTSADSYFGWSGYNSFGFSRDLVGGTSNDYCYGNSAFNADGSISVNFSRYDAEAGNVIVRYMLIA